MSTPVRIQRKRIKGWRAPKGAVYVGRGSRWGNPFVVRDKDILAHPIERRPADRDPTGRRGEQDKSIAKAAPRPMRRHATGATTTKEYDMSTSTAASPLILSGAYWPFTGEHGVQVERGDQSAVAHARDIAELTADVAERGVVDFYGVELDESDVAAIAAFARDGGLVTS